MLYISIIIFLECDFFCVYPWFYLPHMATNRKSQQGSHKQSKESSVICTGNVYPSFNSGISIGHPFSYRRANSLGTSPTIWCGAKGGSEVTTQTACSHPTILRCDWSLSCIWYELQCLRISIIAFTLPWCHWIPQKK